LLIKIGGHLLNLGRFYNNRFIRFDKEIPCCDSIPPAENAAPPRRGIIGTEDKLAPLQP